MIESESPDGLIELNGRRFGFGEEGGPMLVRLSFPPRRSLIEYCV